jgi:hypothetical protein
MGYTTDFNGAFKVTPKLNDKDSEYLTKFARSRRMKRNLPPEFGVEGEFYVGAADDGNYGQDHDKSVVDYNSPPSTQPSLWCQWVPTEDGTAIEWDGGEKFYSYVEWIEYLIEKILKPRGYTLNGKVDWQGESSSDVGRIVIKNNVVRTQKARFIYED